ncbi:MAG: hypothetical protein ACI8PT_004087 [Gammaproteobacteria bacterium]|jgi:hypothetical protein
MACCFDFGAPQGAGASGSGSGREWITRSGLAGTGGVETDVFENSHFSFCRSGGSINENTLPVRLQGHERVEREFRFGSGAERPRRPRPGGPRLPPLH